MAGILSVAALLVVAAEFDINGTLVGEARVGEGPLATGLESRAGVIGVVTPVVDLELRGPTFDLLLDYGPRIFWREPNGTKRIRPLILHMSNLTVNARPTENLTLLGSASGSIGEPDYTALQQLLGTSPATLPDIVDILSVSGRLAAILAATRVWDLGLALDGAHRRPLGQDAMSGSTAATVLLPRQTTFRAEPTAAARLTRRDDLLLLTSVSFQTYSPGAEYVMVTAEAGGRRRLTTRTDLRVVAGVAYAKSWGLPMGVAPAPSLRPIGTAEYHGRLVRGNGLAMDAAAMARVEYYVDPVVAFAVPRGTLAGRCSLLLSQDWMAGIEASFSTSISAGPYVTNAGQVGTPQMLSTNETVAAVAVPIRHRISEHMVFEFGGRWSDRGPHLRAPSFAFQQRQLWGYIMLTWTTRELAIWTTPETNPTEIRRMPRARFTAAPNQPNAAAAVPIDEGRLRPSEGGGLTP